MKNLLISILILVSFTSKAQSIHGTTDSVRLNNIDNVLKAYGKQNVIADKITLVSIGIVVVGSIFKMKPGNMLIANSVCSLSLLAISYKADLKLSKHKAK